MKTINIQASRLIDAAPADVYAVLADYNQGHPAILPKPYFTDLIVEKGGQGAGTVVLAKMTVMGQNFEYHLEVSEPEPGRHLVEADVDTGTVTTFIFEPQANGSKTLLTISTDQALSPGVRGFFEKLFNPGITRKIYQEQLTNIANYLA